jgi:hypothetical protein
MVLTRSAFYDYMIAVTKTYLDKQMERKSITNRTFKNSGRKDGSGSDLAHICSALHSHRQLDTSDTI